MNLQDLAGGVIVFLLAVYLLYALLRPEKF